MLKSWVVAIWKINYADFFWIFEPKFLTEPKKPLTEEERKERAAALQDRLEKARNKRLEEERKEAIEKEKTRRKEGQNIGTIKEDYQQKMMKKQALERKKQKAADAEAKRRVKEQVFTHKKIVLKAEVYWILCFNSLVVGKN